MFKQSFSNHRASQLGLWILAFFFALMASPAFADDATTLGGMMCNAYNNVKPFGKLFQWVAYIGGGVAILQAIHHFRVYSDAPTQKPLTVPIALALGSAALLALPHIAGSVIMSLYGTAGSSGTLDCTRGATPSSSGGGLDVMMSNLIYNIKGPMLSLISLVAILAGLLMIVRGFMKASKYGIDPRTHSVNSIIANVLFGALLLTIGDNLNLVMSSLFGSEGVGGSSAISWSLVNSVDSSGQFKNAVTAALTFVQLLGALAFVRGWLVLKKVVEGGGQATMAQGITFVIGGALAINIYTFLQIMDRTFGTGLLS